MEEQGKREIEKDTERKVERTKKREKKLLSRSIWA